MSEEVFFEADGGVLAAVDHGGVGQPTLLVHGSGHNAAAWDAVIPWLLPDHRVVAVDLRGHGQSSADSVTADQYWRDLAAVTAALGWHRPLLVGHSTGGYAVTAVTAAGLVDPSGICIIDGLVLDERPVAARALVPFRTGQALNTLRRAFGYGRSFDAAQREGWIDKQVADAPGDWLNAGADPQLVRAVATRSLLPDADHTFLRRPTLEEITTVSSVPEDALIYPSIEVYQRISCPMAILLPDRGLYANRRDEIATIASAAPRRQTISVAMAGHNVVMTHPRQVAAAIGGITL